MSDYEIPAFLTRKGATPSPLTTTSRAKRTVRPSPDLMMKLHEAKARVVAHNPHWHMDKDLFTWARFPEQRSSGHWRRVEVRIPVERFWPNGAFPPELLRFMG